MTNQLKGRFSEYGAALRTKKAVMMTSRSPYEDGMSVLDALRWIRINLDSSARDSLQLHQRQRLQNLHGAGERRGGIHLHCEADSGNYHRRTASQAAADSRFGDRHSTRRRKTVASC